VCSVEQFDIAAMFSDSRASAERYPFGLKQSLKQSTGTIPHHGYDTAHILDAQAGQGWQEPRRCAGALPWRAARLSRSHLRSGGCRSPAAAISHYMYGSRQNKAIAGRTIITVTETLKLEVRVSGSSSKSKRPALVSDAT
jgi:hypothetical protein